MAIAPVITFPTSQPGFSSNLQNQTLKGTAHPSTKDILVNGSTDNVSYVAGATGWVFTTMLHDGENAFQVVARDTSNLLSAAAYLDITYNESLNLIVSQPTGITLERSKNSVKISVIQNPEPEVIGYNFYGSEEVGGGTNGFTLLNTILITEPDFFKESSVVLSEAVSTSGNIRTTNTIEKVTRDYYFSYTHDRTTQVLGSKPISEPNHYVVTAVAYDSVLQQQVESTYSAELGTSPLLLDTTVRDLSLRKTADIQQSYIGGILKNDNTVDVKPGTATRDIYINPPSDEFARLYIIQDFTHRSQSFLTLLSFDDSNNDGVSDPVADSLYKTRLQQALLIPDERADEVQTLINDAFTKLAGNVNIIRKQAQKSIGQALFYTRKTPTRDAIINSGGVVETISDTTTSPVQFTVLTDFVLSVADLANYYNPTTARYEVYLDIQAIAAGEIGNVDAEKIQIVVSGIDSIFGVDNPNPTEFGQDIESNNDLAQRAMLAFVSVDAGTEGGYLATTLGTPNVQRAKIISAGEALMQRDLDPLRLVHTYGKVDIYLQGSAQTTYSENFGFTFETVKKADTSIINPSYYHFQIHNSAVSNEKPIFQLIEVRNLTKLANYDLTGVVFFGDGDSFALDNTILINQSIGLAPTDKILTSYRYRDSQPYVFLHQPVASITSVVGETSGTLTQSNYILQKLEDPLKFGNSTESHDQMTILYANGLPTGSIQSILDEAHLLFGETDVELNRYGIDTDTIYVTDSQNIIVYVKDIDYIITPGDQRTKAKIKRTSGSAITSGSYVLIDYQAGENLTVTYAVNTLLLDVQERINTMRHLTADVVVKAAVKTSIDFDIKIMLDEGSDQSSVDRKIRTAISKFLADKTVGDSIFQADIVKVIEDVSGVDHTLIPFTKMVRADGSIIIKEPYTGDWVAHQTINVTSYKSVGTLSWQTSEGGGSNVAFKGVFEKDIDMVLAQTISGVAEEAGRAYIDGNGYVYVSPKYHDIATAGITITYVVQGATGARDISFTDIEYGVLGTLVITYDFMKKSKGF